MSRRAASIQPIPCTANVWADAAVFGNKFMILDCTGTVDVQALNKDSEVIADLVGVPKGLIIGTRDGYSMLKVRAAVGQTLYVVHADADVDLGGIVGAVTVTQQQPNGFTPDVEVVGVASSQLVAPAGATGVLLQADDGNAGNIYLSTATGEGHKLGAGSPVSLPCEAGTTIDVIADAAAQTLYVLWSTRT